MSRGRAFDDAVGAGRGGVVGRVGQRGQGPRPSPGGIGRDWGVHAAALALFGLVRAVGGDAVDGRQDAVEDDVTPARGDPRRPGELWCEAGKDPDRLVEVAADG
ncbi:hypothetical protein GCM10018963_53950 [Saccharothrix longispora]